jgi:hypothetical protein
MMHGQQNIKLMSSVLVSKWDIMLPSTRFWEPSQRLCEYSNRTEGSAMAWGLFGEADGQTCYNTD